MTPSEAPSVSTSEWGGIVRVRVSDADTIIIIIIITIFAQRYILFHSGLINNSIIIFLTQAMNDLWGGIEIFGDC